MICSVCKKVGRMKRCKRCGNVWCEDCARDGKGHYPKQNISNKCPYCGTVGEVETAH